MIQLRKEQKGNYSVEEIERLTSYMQEILDASISSNSFALQERLEEVLEFQDEDGSFKLFHDWNVEAEERIIVGYKPTYICTALLIQVKLHHPVFHIDNALIQALDMCTGRNLKGQGIDDLQGQIENMNFFMKYEVKKFIEKYPSMSEKFTNMINAIVKEYRACIQKEKYVFHFSENHGSDFQKIVKHFEDDSFVVFTYGT